MEGNMRNPGFLCDNFIENHNSLKKFQTKNCVEQCNDCMDKVINHHFMKKTTQKTGVELIAIERAEQIEKHGRTTGYDNIQNDNEQLAQMAECLLAVSHEEGIDSESFPDGWDKDTCAHMIGKPYKQRLIIAGALIAAELDRLQS